MKERPILFSGPMVRAILEGRKTMTRRVVKERVESQDHGRPHSPMVLRNGVWLKPAEWSPYGQPGDRLWVREAWQPGTKGPSYRADFTEESAGRCLNPWKPSIHMPRRFSRITLEVTEVRVERLQDISEEDAAAEGCRVRKMSEPASPEQQTWGELKGGLSTIFRSLWDHLNASRGYGWDANPWVWVVSFRRMP